MMMPPPTEMSLGRESLAQADPRKSRGQAPLRRGHLMNSMYLHSVNMD
jgi:hypothetical protein